MIIFELIKKYFFSKFASLESIILNIVRILRSRVLIAGLLLLSTMSVQIPFSGILISIENLSLGKGSISERVSSVRNNFGDGNNFTFSTNKALASIDYHDSEYNITVGPIAGSVTANYVYASLYNPVNSGKIIEVKRLMVRANAVAAGNFVNLSVRRTTVATGGAQINSIDIPKKNSDSVNSVAEVRSTNPTVTFVGSVDARLFGQPLPGAAGYDYSMREIVFSSSDESIILQQGEGIAVYQEAAGDVDARVITNFEWEELAEPPTPQDEYLMALPRVENAAGVNYVYNSFFNPATSTKTAIIKRVWLGSETCDGAAVYTNNLVLRRITSSSAGTAVSAVNIPKKNTGSSDSIIDIRHTGVTVSTLGGTDARLLNVTPCGTTGEAQGWLNYDSRPSDEQIILKPGEGIALMSDTAGNANQLNRMFVEWSEVVNGSAPASEGEYLWSSSRVEVAAALGNTFYTAFNPVASGKTALVKRIVMRVNADAAATYATFNVQRISTSTGGLLIANTDLPKKHTDSSNAVMQVRWCGAACASTVTTTYVGGRSVAVSGLSDSGIMKTLAPGAVSQLHGIQEIVFVPNEPLVLREGEGLGMYLNYLAGDIDQYVKVSFEWEEVVSPPTPVNRYAIDIGALPGSTAASNNYATFFNPATSTKTAILKQVAVRSNAVAAATYSPIQVKRISAASGGTVITPTNIPKKDTSASTSVMDIRYSGVTATYSQSVDAQLLAVQTPGAVAGPTGVAQSGWSKVIFENDEPIILKPGEGIVLNNNAAADVDHRLYFYVEWEEVPSSSTPAPQGEMSMAIGPVNGSTASGYVYATLFNPATSSKLYVLSRLGLRANRINTLAAPANINVSLRRINAVSSGTVITTDNVPEKNASTTITTADVRLSGVSAVFSGATSSRLFSINAPSLIQQSNGIVEKEFVFGDELVLFPGEGVALYQESAAGDTNLRYYMTAQWREEAVPAGPPYLTFSISDNSIGFGPLSSLNARYATGNLLGTSTIYTTAHTISAATNGAGGYAITLNGSTLSSGAFTINPIGSVSLSPSIGAEQFGISFSVASGTGSAIAPYDIPNQYAFATSTFPDVIATGLGDNLPTIFNVSYVSNISANTESGVYTTLLNYVITGTF